MKVQRPIRLRDSILLLSTLLAVLGLIQGQSASNVGKKSFQSNSNNQRPGTLAMKTDNATGTSTPKVFSYYNFRESGIQPWQIPADKVTHLIWSFANIVCFGFLVGEFYIQ
jgi:GH18 family chitinase